MLPPNNRKGSGFTNINRVVTANQGNKLGSTVTSGVQNQANQVKQDTQKATTNFNEEAQSNRLDTDEAKNNRDQTIGRFSNVNETAEQSVSDDDVNNFAKYRTGTYEGPNQLKDYQSLAGKAANTEQLGDLSRSGGGRQELLKRFVGGTGYTQGQQGLDNLLLGQSGNSLNQVRRSTQGLSNDVAGANTQASSLAQEYANRAKTFGEETTGKLTAARDPISGKVDEQLIANQGQEATRKNNFKFLQDSLMGTSDDYKGLDRITRLGLGLQSAKDAGYLTDAQSQQLLGDGGLIQRSEQLGLDTNSLLNERLKDISAQNLTRGGAASSVQESQLNALDRLMGKQGTDLEFNQAGADFQKGNIGFDTDTLNDYLNTTEKAKYANDAAKLADQEAYNKRYLNQAVAGGKNMIGGSMQAVGGALAQTLDPTAIFKPGQTVQNGTAIVEGLGQAGLGNAQMASQGGNALMEGLTKLNIGGNSLANTEGGKQLLKAIELKSKLENEAFAAGGKALNTYTDGFSDLSKGNIGGAIGDLSGYNIAKDLGGQLNSNIAREIANNDVGKALGKISSGVGNTLSSGGEKLKKAVCFHGDTNILMADGTFKNIKDIQLGEEMKLGGKVMIRGEAFSNDIYLYNGVKVSGTHAVFENGTWIRVQDSKVSVLLNEESVVYPIINEKHIMVTEGQIWADMFEVDDFEGKTKHVILEQLNSDKERNLALLGIYDEIKEIKQK